MIEAAIEYVQYAGKDEGNNLEITGFKKRHDVGLLEMLKADALTYYFLYSKLVMLAKSVDINKSGFDMNKQYSIIT